MSTRRRLFLATLLAAAGAVWSTPGCHRRNLPHVVPVNGIVLYQRQPIAGATVILVAKEGRLAAGEFASGMTDAQGRFSLTAHIAGSLSLSGAVPGRHRVVISKFVPPFGMTEGAYQQRLDAERRAMAARGTITLEEAAPAKVELLPAKYSNMQETILSAVVEDHGNNKLTFDLD